MSAAWSDRALLAGLIVTIAAVKTAAAGAPHSASAAVRAVVSVATTARSLLGL